MRQVKLPTFENFSLEKKYWLEELTVQSLSLPSRAEPTP
jgi:hypothetical protein